MLATFAATNTITVAIATIATPALAIVLLSVAGMVCCATLRSGPIAGDLPAPSGPPRRQFALQRQEVAQIVGRRGGPAGQRRHRSGGWPTMPINKFTATPGKSAGQPHLATTHYCLRQVVANKWWATPGDDTLNTLLSTTGRCGQAGAYPACCNAIRPALCFWLSKGRHMHKIPRKVCRLSWVARRLTCGGMGA